MAASTAPQPFREDIQEDVYASEAFKWMRLGVTLIGGCCGIGPTYIKKLAEMVNAENNKADM